MFMLGERQYYTIKLGLLLLLTPKPICHCTRFPSSEEQSGPGRTLCCPWPHPPNGPRMALGYPRCGTPKSPGNVDFLGKSRHDFGQKATSNKKQQLHLFCTFDWSKSEPCQQKLDYQVRIHQLESSWSLNDQLSLGQNLWLSGPFLTDRERKSLTPVTSSSRCFPGGVICWATVPKTKDMVKNCVNSTIGLIITTIFRKYSMKIICYNHHCEYHLTSGIPIVASYNY